MDISQLSLIKLTDNSVIKSFKCKDDDLNDFLFDDALKYASELMAVTYIFEFKDDTVVYFSLSNDNINLKDSESIDRNRVNRSIPNAKRINSYPAVKIGRLAVSENYEHKGIGSQVLSLVKQMFTYNNKTGCRFITVDAYAAAINFYENNGFVFLTENDRGEDTRLMYFDLKKML